MVTTLLLGVLVPVLRASESKATEVREQIGLQVFLYRDATKAEIEALDQELAGIPHVTAVEYCSPACAKRELADELRGDLEGSIQELNSNPLPPTFKLELDDPTTSRRSAPRSRRRTRPASRPRSAPRSIRPSARIARTRPRSARSPARSRSSSW